MLSLRMKFAPLPPLRPTSRPFLPCSLPSNSFRFTSIRIRASQLLSFHILTNLAFSNPRQITSLQEDRGPSPALALFCFLASLQLRPCDSYETEPLFSS